MPKVFFEANFTKKKPTPKPAYERIWWWELTRPFKCDDVLGCDSNRFALQKFSGKKHLFRLLADKIVLETDTGRLVVIY